jgi:hypothetical protein
MRFVAWLNTLFDDGTTYLLPAPAVLANPDAALTPILAQCTVWTAIATKTVLYQANRVPWPYTPTQDQIAEYPEVLLEHIRPAFQLAQTLTASTDRDIHHLLGYINTFAPRLSDPLDPWMCERVMVVDRARDLFDALEFVLDLEAELKTMGAGRGELGRTLDITYHLNAALAHELELIHALTPDPWSQGEVDALNRALDRVRALAIDLANAREQFWPEDNPLIRKCIRELGRDLAGLCDVGRADVHCGGRNSAREHARELNCASAEERARNLPLLAVHRARSLPRRRACGLEFDLAPGRTAARDLHVAGARGITRDLARMLEGSRAPESDLKRGRHFTLARARASDLDRALTRDLTRTFAYELACSLGNPYEKVLQTMVAAADALLRSWPNSLVGTQVGDGQARSSFRRFLTKALATSTAGTTRTAEDPGDVIRRLQGRLLYRSDVCALCEHVRALIEPILDRTAPVDRTALAVAGAGLLAAIILLQAHEETTLLSAREVKQIAGQLAQALGTLIALTGDETKTTANQVLLLVRI